MQKRPLFLLLSCNLLVASENPSPFEKELKYAFDKLLSRRSLNEKSCTSSNKPPIAAVSDTSIFRRHAPLCQSILVGSVMSIVTYRLTCYENIQFSLTSGTLVTCLAYRYFQKK